MNSTTFQFPTTATATPNKATRTVRDFSFRLHDDGFASDDAVDADDDCNPFSSAEDDIMENSPRPSRPTRSFGRIPKFKLDTDSDGNPRTDDDDEGEHYVSRRFSESSITTAVPLQRNASAIEGMYTSFRLQRPPNAGTSRARSRRGSLLNKASVRSPSKSQSRSLNRPHASSNAARETSIEGGNAYDLTNPDNRTTVLTSEPAGTVVRKRSRSRIDAWLF